MVEELRQPHGTYLRPSRDDARKLLSVRQTLPTALLILVTRFVLLHSPPSSIKFLFLPWSHHSRFRPSA